MIVPMLGAYGSQRVKGEVCEGCTVHGSERWLMNKKLGDTKRGGYENDWMGVRCEIEAIWRGLRQRRRMKHVVGVLQYNMSQ